MSKTKSKNSPNVEHDDNVRIIKKYPNRRVYDTETSQYIKIGDLREMIVKGIDFMVIDTQSKQDVTRSVLLQIIIDQESEVNPLFTSENLKNFIRYYGSGNDVFSAYLNNSLSQFSRQQQEISDYFYKHVGSNPMEAFTEASKQNIELWQTMQKQFFESFKSDDNEKE